MKKKLSIVLLFLIMLFLLSPNMSFAVPIKIPGLSGNQGGGGRSGPTYYSYEDLRSGISDQSFYFANINKPNEAYANLGYFPPFSACASKKKEVVNKISADPTKYGVNSIRIMTNWNDNDYHNFDNSAWAKYKGLRGETGDIIFTRGNGLGSDIVKKFSNWTHVAMVYDANTRLVFESTSNGGVQVNDTVNSWKDVTYYTCKHIKNTNMQLRKDKIDKARSKYRNIPYFPQVSNAVELISFIFKWSDKDDQNSMYCSKLVYNTYKDIINLDSNNTHVFTAKLQDKAPGAPFFSWIGISPDDIYYSSSLDYDYCMSSNMYNL